jgi:2'-hydroxyisoflavone reductase|nr:NAD-dependent epimerase/dehydratase family protein [Kofleriaceae bacterium]
MTRRELLGLMALAACGHGLETTTASTTQTPATAKPKPMKILVLGGTNFLGPHVVTAALARGHAITLFNRGKTHAELFPTVEKLRGDRDGKLDALRGRQWDAVIDPSGFVPRIVTMSAELLAPNVGHYIFISSISVYAGDTQRGADESQPVEVVADDVAAKEDAKTNYGALKARSERAAEAAMPGRVLNVRPGLIVGPGDPTGRFTHWPSRLRDGGDVLAPGDGSTPVQWIDGRDLGAWLVTCCEQRTVGTMNALGPSPGRAMRDVLADVARGVGTPRAPLNLVWVDAAFLKQQAVSGWSDLPMWIDATGDDAGFGTLSNARAVAAGLAQRPLADTARDTLAWLDQQPADPRAKLASSGISRDREAAVLAAWRARTP